MSAPKQPVGSRRSPPWLAAWALVALVAAAAVPLPGLPLRGITRLELAPAERLSLTVDLPAGASLVLKARGDGAAPGLSLTAPDGEVLDAPITTRGRLTVVRGAVADVSGLHTITLTDGGDGGGLVVVTRTRWSGRGQVPIVDGVARVPLLSAGPALPASLVVKAPKGGLDAPLELLGLVTPDGQPVELPPGAVRVSSNGRVLRLGPLSLPGGQLQALLGGTPAPGTPPPDLAFRQGLRFSRAARLR